MSDQTSEVRRLFSGAFGCEPQTIARAPGRVEILGNHTDYNEGYVLSAAIDRHITVAAGKGAGPAAMEAVSSEFPGVVSVKDIAPQKAKSWVNYPLGVMAMLRKAGRAAGPARIAVCGDIPLGAGLSSSAALETATGLALSALFDLDIEPEEMAKICQKAEHEFAGAKCGLLDQYSVLFGEEDHLLFIDFRTLEHETVTLRGTGISLAITPSGVTHALVEGAYNERRAQCFAAAEFFAKRDRLVKTLRDVTMERLQGARAELDDKAYRRAMHVVGENERVLRGMELLEDGDVAGFGALLFESHESSRVNFENSCPELDVLVDIARGAEGVYGSRLSGGGFGGAALAVLAADACGAFERTVTEQYRARTGRATRVHFTPVAGGARVVVRESV